MEKNYVSYLECSITGKKYEANKIHGLSDAGRPLLVRYDLQTLKKEVSRDDIKNSTVDGLWRYSPLYLYQIQRIGLHWVKLLLH